MPGRRRITALRLVPILLLMMLAGRSLVAENYTETRRQMVDKIEMDVRATSEYLQKQALDPRVLEALRRVPRHEFVESSLRSQAYENRPLPIGHGQTISQPYIVAVMTDLLKPKPGDRVFELGTGSGYQAAILAQLVGKVYTMEIIEPLGVETAQRLKRLGYDNVHVRVADGYYGWKEHAPYDGIIVTAAASHIPPPLIDQLKPGGRMVIPVGGPFMTQQLLLVEKDAAGKLVTRQVLPVRFVPLTGKHSD